MTKTLLRAVISATLVVALLLQPGWNVTRTKALLHDLFEKVSLIPTLAQSLTGTGERTTPASARLSTAPALTATNNVFLPLIMRPPGPPSFEITAPNDGWTVSGMLYFAAQPIGPAPISSVSFRAGSTSLGTDSTPADGFKAFFNARNFPAGPLQLVAIASGPSGQTSKSITVNVLPDPPSSGRIGSQGGVLDSEIGSIITIPPGALPDGTLVTIDELTQQEVTAQNGINWEALGVTFLGAQRIQSAAPFSLPYGVASANFGNRVQPGQAVVNYQIYPDADGDGADEIVVVNTASVAPNNDVISDPVPQVILDSATTQLRPGAKSFNILANGISGPTGATIKIRASGFNPASLSGNVGSWTSLVNGETIETPGLVFLDPPNDTTRQIFSTVIPPLPAGTATLILRNESTGSTAGPIAVTIAAPTPLSAAATDIVDQLLVDTITFLQNVPTSSPEQTAALTEAIAKFTQSRADFAQLVTAGLTPEDQLVINKMALIIQNSDIYTVGSSQTIAHAAQTGYSTDARVGDVVNFLWGVATIVGGIAIAATATTFFLGFAAGVTIAAGVLVTGYYLCKLIRGGTCFDDPASDPPSNPLPPTQPGSGAGRTGMGSAPPPGGNGGGNMGGAGGGGARSPQAGGEVIIKVYSAGSPIPFSGVTDPGGYFFIPLIPAGEPFIAVAYDLVNNQTRIVEGIGPNTGSSVFLFFDFYTEQVEYDTVYWDGEGDGASWHDPFNWNPNLIPGPTQHVIVDVPGTITVVHSLGNDAVLSLRSEEAIRLAGGTLELGQASVLSDTFILSGGTLGGTGALSVTGVLSWTGGTMSGSGTTTALGDLLLTGPSPKLWRDGRTLINAGTAVWNGGYLWGINHATFNNRAGATFQIEVDNFIYASSGVTFTNAGTLVKSAGSGTSALQPVFNNLGSVNVQSGTLNLTGDSVHSGVVQGSGRVEFSSGTHILTTTSSLNTANVQISSGTTQVNGVFAPVATTLTGGTLLFNRDATNPTFTQSGGTLGGTGALSVTGVLSWTGGTMSGPGTTIALGDLLLTGPSPKLWRDGRTLINAGTAVWNGGYVWGINHATFNNRAGATFDIQTDNFIYASSGVTLTNAGTLIKSVVSGTSTLQPVFNNLGSVNVQSGTLNLTGSSTHSGLVQGSGRVEFGAGTHILTATSSLNTANVQISSGTTQVYGVFAPGATTLSNGSLILNRDATHTTFTQSGGTLGGTGTLSVTGVLSWTGGTMSGPGTTIALGDLLLTGPSPKLWRDGRTLINAGTAVWNGGYVWGINHATFNNRAGATFDIQTNNFIYASSGVTLTNAGTLIKSVVSGTTTLQPVFNNLGSVTVQSGTLQFGSSFVQGATGILNVQIGGLAPIADFDQFRVTGLANLDGTLNVTLINGYVPSPGNSFQIMTYGSRAGQFATVNGNGQPYTVNYTATNVTLVAQ
ncbi:hypothetical protein TFLX_00690 [Thermoflexales bacterium]|nr:hypothetical protein TFLX_00690 [Thermoflexales bacterium]